MVFRWLTERRRRQLLEQPFPAAWAEILQRNVAAYALLDGEEQARLRDLVQVFIAEKHWEGAGGLELTDEIRVTVAGSGCLLLLGRDHDLFAEVASIVIYPSSVLVPEVEGGAAGFGGVVGGATAVKGLAVKRGPLVLAWDSALHGARDPKDGHNVVIHELAHKIDFLDGEADGTPPLPDAAARHAWGQAFEAAFLAHRKRFERGKKSALDDYAVVDEAEYFAVATETFFEKPRVLQRNLPDVYAALRDFYNLDLAARDAAARRR